MISRQVEVDVGSLRDQPVARADMVVRLRARDGAVRLLARDSSTGRFAGLSVTRTPGSWHPAGVADEAVISLFALSPDGSRLLLGDPDLGLNRLSLHTLATGTAVILPPGPGDGVNAAAFTPEGNQVATLAHPGDKATVTVLDVDGGQERELWSTEGATASDTMISWSPNSSYLAVTYLDPDDSYHTVILDRGGTVAADIPEMAIVGTSRLCWTGDHDLVLTHEYWEDQDAPRPIVLADAAAGQRREVAQPQRLGTFGALDGRVLRRPKGGQVISTAFDGSDPRPVLDVGPDYAITFFDATPGALDTGD